MYLARVKEKKGITYYLRESVPRGDVYDFQDLFHLGPRPGAWIDYPGGNAWYLNPDMEAIVSKAARHFDADELEDLFWPFIRPDIRRAVETFRDRGRTTGYRPMGKKEKQALSRATHAFDKRRAHFLKFGNMDQGPLVNMPAVLFKGLAHKSRDEIEQGFMAQEGLLRARDLKSYVYTIFDLQRFFKSFMAKKMPHVLDQDRVEAYFLEELCRINTALFNRTDRLHHNLVRYLIMFFDHTYGDTLLLDDLARDFMSRHRHFRPRPRPSVSAAKARDLFNLSEKALKTMDKKGLTRIYRKLARKHHPDKGGDHDRFVEINEAFQALLKIIS